MKTPPHDHIGQNLGGFKRENNQCIRSGEKAKLHNIKIVVFLTYICGAMTRISSRITPLPHNNVIRDQIGIIAPQMLSPKSYNFDPMQLYLFSAANALIVFAFKTP